MTVSCLIITHGSLLNALLRNLQGNMYLCAAEDVGNADPMALVVAVNASLAVERIGMPGVSGRPVKFLSAQLIRQILLLYIMIRIVVSIFIARSPPQLGRSLIMRVLQMGRNGQVSRLLHRLHGLENGITAGVALGGTGNIGRSLGQNNLGLRHPDPLHGQGGIYSQEMPGMP